MNETTEQAVIEHGTPKVCPPHNMRDGRCSACGWPEKQTCASQRFLNVSQAEAHALRCSVKFRAGRFSRVGQAFTNEVEADLEAWVRSLSTQLAKDVPVQLHEPLEPEGTMVTGALIDKILERFKPELNRIIGRIIQNKVWRQPSSGITLKATR